MLLDLNHSVRTYLMENAKQYSYKLHKSFFLLIKFVSDQPRIYAFPFSFTFMLKLWELHLDVCFHVRSLELKFS